MVWHWFSFNFSYFQTRALSSSLSREHLVLISVFHQNDLPITVSLPATELVQKPLLEGLFSTKSRPSFNPVMRHVSKVNVGDEVKSVKQQYVELEPGQTEFI